MSGLRTFLFLQGPSSPLFVKIAAHLEKAGHLCLRVNLHAGDRLFWLRRGGFAYRGRPEHWPAWIERFLEAHAVTDLVLLGEERPYHASAAEAARRWGAAVHVVEMGYLRPDWVTIERDGMSSNSRFPVDPQAILAAAAELPEPDWTPQFRQSFVTEALYDLAYNLPSVFLRPFYPHYRRHALFHPLAEYAGWTGRLLTQGRRMREATAAIVRLKRARVPYFVYPLQLQTDYQLRAHSPYDGQQQAIAEILASFARHAPQETHLAVKVHPLDNGLIRWGALVGEEARRLGVEGRVRYFDGGNLTALIRGSRGIVTVNSTAALHALRRGVPAKVLGVAIYDIDGMTDRQPLDTFWQAPHRPDPALTGAFYRLLAASIQVRGNFYSAAGSSAAAAAIAERLLAGSVNLPGGDSGGVPRRKPQKRRP